MSLVLLAGWFAVGLAVVVVSAAEGWCSSMWRGVGVDAALLGGACWEVVTWAADALSELVFHHASAPINTSSSDTAAPISHGHARLLVRVCGTTASASSVNEASCGGGLAVAAVAGGSADGSGAAAMGARAVGTAEEGESRAVGGLLVTGTSVERVGPWLTRAVLPRASMLVMVAADALAPAPPNGSNANANALRS